MILQHVHNAISNLPFQNYLSVTTCVVLCNCIEYSSYQKPFVWQINFQAKELCLPFDEEQRSGKVDTGKCLGLGQYLSFF